MTPLTPEEHAKDIAVRLFKAARTTMKPSDWKRFNTFMRNLGHANKTLWRLVTYHLSWEINGIGWNSDSDVIHKHSDDEPMPVPPILAG
jgi:hypothetical protein